MSNMDELRYLSDVANDPALEKAKRRFKKGIKKLKKKLKRGTRKSSELQTARKWNRTISGNAIIKYEQYGDDFSSYISRAVSFMRDTWGSDDNPLLDINDAMIHGLTALFVFLDKAGQIEGGTQNGLNGKKKHVLAWMNSDMGKTSMRKYYHNSAGGNTHFKIVHNIMQEYNFWAEDNASTMTITKEYLHLNGILDPTKMMTKAERKVIPSFPSDIII